MVEFDQFGKQNLDIGPFQDVNNAGMQVESLGLPLTEIDLLINKLDNDSVVRSI